MSASGYTLVKQIPASLASFHPVDAANWINFEPIIIASPLEIQSFSKLYFSKFVLL
jgi:hypothetical protein